MKPRRPSAAPKAPSRLRQILSASRLGAVVALAVGLASCAIAPSSRYPAKGDVRPHAGVASAHGLPVHGVDISKWQGKVDWAALRQAGTKFAFIKATEGGDHVDNRFIENWNGARQAGVPRGAYHFVYWCRPAHEQAQWFKRNVPYDPTALPPVLDVEWNGESVNCPRKVPREQALSHDQPDAERDGGPYGQAPHHLHGHHLPPGNPGGRVHRLPVLDPQHRRRAPAPLQRPPLDLLAIHHHGPRAAAFRATSTATPSTAPTTNGACSSPAIATPATTSG